MGAGAEIREQQFKEEGGVNRGVSEVRGAVEQGLSYVPSGGFRAKDATSNLGYG